MRALLIPLFVAGCGGAVSISGARALVNGASSCAPDACWTYDFSLRLVNRGPVAVTGLTNARFSVGGQTLAIAEQKLPCHADPWNVPPGETSVSIDLELQSYPTLAGSGRNSFGYPCGEPTMVLTFVDLDGTQLKTAPQQVGLELELALDGGGTTTAGTQLTATTPPMF